MTAPPLAAAAIAQLEAEGVDAVIGTVVNPAGLTHAKTVPIRRTNTFADPGVGASPVWHVFAIDQTGIAFTDAIGVVGDQRIRIDLSALRIIGDGLAWAPGGFFEQDGTPVPACSRGTLRRVEAALAEADVKAVVGHEIEFVLVNPDGSRLPSTLWRSTGWPACSSTKHSSAMSSRWPPRPVWESNSYTPNTGPTSSRFR
ncbi:glutamine synthetase, catalytic domain protein [Mycobacterium xenopi 3993]|nr:glutamine synthetase, catalytic domain protein [Mycobacterium xenopi 3993]